MKLNRKFKCLVGFAGHLFNASKFSKKMKKPIEFYVTCSGVETVHDTPFLGFVLL